MNNTVSCPVCGQYASESFKAPYAAVWRCQASDCRHFFAPNAEQEDGLCDYSTQAYKTKFIQRNHRLIDYLLEKRIIKQGQRILDLGSGEGHIASCFAERGFDVLCVEPSNDARTVLTSRGLKSVPYASDIEPGEIFNFIYLIEVIEHIPSPTDVLRDASRHLSHEAHLLVSTPSAHSLLAHISKKRSNSFGVPSHKHFFIPRSLYKCLTLAGFKTVHRCSPPLMLPDRPVAERFIASCLNLLGLGGGIAVLASHPEK